MRRLARIAVGLALAATPVALSGASAVHATQLNETCLVDPTTINFVGTLSLVYNGPYARNWTDSCEDLDLQTSPPGVVVMPGLPLVPTAGAAGGNASGTCAALLMNGGNPPDFRGGAGVLIGGSVLVAGSAFPLTSDVAYAEVDVLVPNGIPCLTETSATGAGINDTVL